MLGLKMNTVETILTIICGLATIIGIHWSIIKYLHRFKQKVLYFTNCHLIHISLWDYMKENSKYSGIKCISHTFTPLILIPLSYKNFVNWHDGDDVIINFIKGDGNSFFAQAKMFWLPNDKELQCYHFKHPCMSLVLRRYFGIERPILGIDDDKETNNWKEILHPKEDLDPQHRVTDDKGNMKWQCNKAYSNRFCKRSGKKDEYYDNYVEGSYLEYCGFSIEIKKKSFLINKELS